MRIILLLSAVACAVHGQSTTTDGLFVRVTETSTNGVTETFTPYCVVSVGTACSASGKRRKRAAILAALPDGFDDVSYNALHERVKRSVTEPEALDSSQQVASEEKQGRIIPILTLTYTSYTTTTQYIVTDTQTISASPSCDIANLAVPTCGTVYTVSTYTATTFTASTTETTIDTSYVSEVTTSSYTNTKVDPSTVGITSFAYTATDTFVLSVVTYTFSTLVLTNTPTVVSTATFTANTLSTTTTVVSVTAATTSTVTYTQTKV